MTHPRALASSIARASHSVAMAISARTSTAVRAWRAQVSSSFCMDRIVLFFAPRRDGTRREPVVR